MKLKVQTNRYFSSIGQFCFIKQIGLGSFGVVKLALHLSTNRCYAAKIIDLNQTITENEILLLERQINLHSKIDHPHIIKLWDTLIQENIVYMIMQLAQNGTLFTYQNNHRIITEQQGFRFFSQTLSAIKYMHSCDIMHRDIKPENILLDSSCNVKLCDLGWATDNIHQKRKTFCGTYQYMAPQMVFQKQYNSTIDIWALGILLYQILHGYAPFSAKNLEQMKEKVQQGYYEISNTLGKEIKSLIIDILQFDGQLRPKFESIMSHAWMDKMKKEIKAQIIHLKGQTNIPVPNRAKIDKQKGASSGKKHKRFDSLLNQNYIKKMTESSYPTVDGTAPFQKHVQQKKVLKKKCKTQGEESLQKLLTETNNFVFENRSKLKKEKENNPFYRNELSKTANMKNETSASTAKMKKIAEKLNELTSKYPSDKKKGRLKTTKQDF